MFALCFQACNFGWLREEKLMFVAELLRIGSLSGLSRMNKRENIPGKQSSLGEIQKLTLPVVHLGSSLLFQMWLSEPKQYIHREG